MKKGILAIVILAFALAVVAPVFAEETPQEKPAAKASLKTQVIQLKYREAGWTQPLLRPFLSEVGRITFSQMTDKMLVVSDYAENVDKVLQAIRQIDVKPVDLQFTVQLVLGSDAEEKGADSVANDPVIKELRNLLKYKSYSLLDTSMVRAMDNTEAEVRMGDKGDFAFWVMPKVVKDEKSSLIQMFVRLRQFHEDPRVAVGVVEPAKGNSTVTDLIGTTLNIKPGEKTVVGVSKLDGGGKGLILIISGKIVE